MATPTDQQLSAIDFMLRTPSFVSSITAQEPPMMLPQSSAIREEVADVLDKVAELSLREESIRRPQSARSSSLSVQTPVQQTPSRAVLEPREELFNTAWNAMPPSPQRLNKRDFQTPSSSTTSGPSLATKRCRSNSFLVHNAPRLPGSPDFPDVPGETSHRAHHQIKYPPPMFSPLHKVALVNNNNNGRDGGGVALIGPNISSDDFFFMHQEEDEDQEDENDVGDDEQQEPPPPPPPMPLMSSSPMIRRKLRMRPGDAAFVAFSP